MKKILLPISALLVTGFVHAQLTPTENYVYSKTYLSDPSLPNCKTSETVQYFDGLGRAKQVVNIKASPLGKDVVTHIEYDGFGRQVKDYLPVPQSSTMNGAIVPNPLANAVQPALYGSEKIYAEKLLENSPLDRVLEQKQVGNDWNSRPVKFEYDANIAGEVKKYVTTTTWVNGATSSVLSMASDSNSENGNYKASQLYKTTVIDEDGNKTVEFKNGQGQTILVRKVLSATENADTYYVYNEYNQLAFVIPPLASVSASIDEAVLNNLCYQYRYDGKNRLVEKKLSGKGWEYMVYDKADRLIFTQDANMRANSKWLMTKYDQLGRVIYTGILPGGDRTGMQNQAGSLVITESRHATGFTRNGLQIYYSNGLFTDIETVLSVNYYDTYPTGSPSIPTQILGQDVLNDNAQNGNISTKSLPVASYVKNIEDDNWTKTYSYYDRKGRTVGSYSINHLGGYTRTESLLDFAGTAQQVKTYHKRLNTDTEKIITENFEYDAQNRLLVHKHKVDNNTEEILVQNEYNELSQLTTKKVGGTNAATPLQTVDYAYNIRGWMTRINDPANLGNDLFGYKIKYNQVEGEETPNNDFPDLKVKPKYNGNIAEIDWKTGTTPGDNLKRYGYVYDGLNRLLAGFYQKDVNPTAKEYFEKIDYDLNGNITNLKRSEGVLQGTTAMTIDNLTYQYMGTNRLQSVTDDSFQYSGYPDVSGNTISYDANGNMTNQIDKGILNIDYNFLNLPKKITFNQAYIIRNSNGSTEERNARTSYVYRADGTKLRKGYTAYFKNFAERTTTTDYLDGFQYTVNYAGVVTPEFVPTSEGYFNFKDNTYIYNYTDHLGNVRLSYFKNANSSAEVLEENNYYPFGLKHEGYNANGGNPA
ncbi:DUF6443 domain-containing protein, partial [Chryseobacterium sp. GMJ5]